ncbi:hypothetical protein [Amycolatopsis sp. CA-126428]|uniref:hypothetical protein n=1 Tax=Amycolatopsis sp. CA-126428 TaxID=2073158 RepID=UPI001E643AA7|nr:hypothetical protein [Amycolatopsis sp. CA-126428]
MTFTVDPQVAAILAPMAEAVAAAPHPAVGDIATRRVALEAMMAETAALQPTPADVTVTDFHAVAGDGTKVLLRWVEFHLHPGVPHEFETCAWDTDVARRAVADRLRVLGSL